MQKLKSSRKNLIVKINQVSPAMTKSIELPLTGREMSGLHTNQTVGLVAILDDEILNICVKINANKPDRATQCFIRGGLVMFFKKA